MARERQQFIYIAPCRPAGNACEKMILTSLINTCVYIYMYVYKDFQNFGTLL